MKFARFGEPIWRFIVPTESPNEKLYLAKYLGSPLSMLLYSEFDLQIKFWGFVFETWFGENQKILLHWGDTMSKPCKNLNFRFKLDLQLLVWKEDRPVFDGGTGEVARKATPSKLFSDRLKSVLATKCHLNSFLKEATYLKESDITEVRFPIVQMMGLDAHLCVLKLNGRKSYVLEEVCAFPFPSSLGLSNIEGLLSDLERIYEETRYCQENSMERVSRGKRNIKKISYKSWITDVLQNEEDESEEDESEEEERGEEEGIYQEKGEEGNEEDEDEEGEDEDFEEEENEERKA
ncbi:hypothetical protein BDC45DRAFT_525199 [Circinella umbellata]|nr:hypothetical protein BDC45DRAFT_525199 [Circinella umbellata]